MVPWAGTGTWLPVPGRSAPLPWPGPQPLPADTMCRSDEAGAVQRFGSRVKGFYLAGWSLWGGHCRWNPRAETVRQGVHHWLTGLHTKYKMMLLTVCSVCSALSSCLLTLNEEELFLSTNSALEGCSTNLPLGVVTLTLAFTCKMCIKWRIECALCFRYTKEHWII